MKIEVKPPNRIPKSVFLAGSIEMGKAIDWQKQLSSELTNCIIYNPRRDDWNSSWEQSISNAYFCQQVYWELNALDKADIIALYFVPGTQSPISLLELGLFANSEKLIVCCPDGFWRKGNVDIVCHRYGIATCKDLEELTNTIKWRLENE